MKDLLKRLLCIVLALTMVVALVACGSSDEDEDEEEDEKTAEEGGKKSNKDNDDEEEEEEDDKGKEDSKKEDTLVGDWEATIDLSEYLNEMLAAELGMDLEVEDFAIVMTLSFDEDGTYEAGIDTSKMEDAMEDIVDVLWDAMMEMTAEEAGMSVSEVEEMMEQQGVTKDMLMEEMDLEAAMAEAFEEFEDESKGEWVLDGDELYMAKNDPEDADPVEIEFDGDEFSIVGGDFLGDADEEMVEYIMPIVFERV